MGRKHAKNDGILPIFLGGPMGPIHPVWGNGCNISSAIRIKQWASTGGGSQKFVWIFWAWQYRGSVTLENDPAPYGCVLS